MHHFPISKSECLIIVHYKDCVVSHENCTLKFGIGVSRTETDAQGRVGQRSAGRPEVGAGPGKAHLMMLGPKCSLLIATKSYNGLQTYSYNASPRSGVMRIVIIIDRM